MRLADLEDAYELTPMQQGMLFHTLFAPESGQYFEQLVCDLRGALDVAAFTRAWELEIRQHPIFRTSFVTDGDGKPVQVVHRDVKLPLEQHDWRSLSPEDQRTREESFLRADRNRGFDLARAPLMRGGLFRLDDDVHRFVWSRHHLLLDAWSRSLVFAELFSAYEAFRTGREFTPPSSRPYGDYIAWLQEQDLGKAERYWRNAFRDFPGPSPLEMGVVPRHLKDPNDVYEEQVLRITASVTSKLRAFARKRSLTFNTLIQATWALLLGRYSDREDVVFGAAVSGRPAGLDGVESMIGLFVNTLPVRVRLSAEARLGAWLAALQGQQAELREYEYSPLVDVQRWSGVQGGRPLFDTLVVFENTPRSEPPGMQERSLEVLNVRGFGSRTGYPLSLLVDVRDELILLAVSDSRRYDAAAVTRMLGHLGTLLEAVTRQPERTLGELPILGPEESRQILGEWNQTSADYPSSQSVDRMFEAQASKTPDRIAVVSGETRSTFRDVNRRANQLARYLVQLGVERGDLVGVCLERSPDMVAVLLGILKAGAAYVPLDPSYPGERLAFILKDSGARVAVAERKSSSRLPQGHARILCLEDEAARIGEQADDDLEMPITAEDLMYVIYTSGSTGQPKGVEALHRASLNRFAWMWSRYPFSSDEAGCLTTSLNFVDSVWEIFGPLLQGVPVSIVPEEVVKDPARLIAALEVGAVTRLVAVPSLLRAITEAIGSSSDRLPQLRYCVSSGEALSVDLARRYLERLPHSLLINLYGSSEVAGDVTYYEVRETALPFIPIGRPIFNTQIYILDSRMRPVPVGVAGHLFVGGEGLARGYRGRPDLTSERFVPNPFVGEPGPRLYKTGDNARYLSDGNIEYLGRSDHQVKIRGFRVELGEIEAALGCHPAVRETVVVARPDAGGMSLVAYVCFADEQPTDLREFLKQKLPDYMVPSVFVPLERLPLTPNGKVDRAALPDPDTARGAARGSFEAPRSPVEDLLALIWAEVLQLERVGIHENFFDLGGHSLLATRVVSRIRDAFGVDVPLRSLFGNPTIAGVAQQIESAARAEEGIETPPLRKAPRTDRFPLSFPQQRLWFVQQLEPTASHYNVPQAIRVKGPLDVQSLEKALTEIVRRHESLRTSFVSIDGEPFQRIREDAAVSVLIDALDGVPEVGREAELMRLLREDSRRTFDLSRDSLLRIRLVRLGPDDHVLVFTLHHIVCDAWSLRIFLRELWSLYGAFATGRESPLPELPIQYVDYAVWQRELLKGEVLARLLSYWRRAVGAELPTLALKTDRPRPPLQSFRGGRHSLSISGDLTEKLRTIGRDEGATLFMVLLAAFQTLLSREAGQTDIAVGTDIANRSRVETEKLIGFFVNLLVLRTDLSGNPRFQELLGRVREVALGAYAHQDLPFDKLVEELKPDRDLSRNPLVQVLFVMQNLQGSAVEPPGLQLTPIDPGTEVARFDLAVFVNAADRGLWMNWIYNADLFEPSTIKAMAERFGRLLESIAERPDMRLENLEMLSEAEKKRLAETKSERERAQRTRLRSMRRKGVDLSSITEVKLRQLNPEEPLPLVIEPAEEAIDLVEWSGKERESLEAHLLRHGAILFRDFGLKSAEEFERFASALCPELFGEYGDLPREAVGGKVYGSTPYPSDQPILFHNESSHMHRWPMKIWFFCVLPAERGGETPIVDCRAVYKRLDPGLRQRFFEKGLLYVRNYTEGLDVTWQSFFGTDDRGRVEELCRGAGADCEWRPGNGLRTRQLCPAAVRHPQTGEMAFFNQLQLHHVSCLDPAVRESLSSLMTDEDLPRNVYYGDGSRIEDSVMDEIRGVYRETAVAFPWRQGDILMLNNMLVAHARNPYEGARKIVVAMGEMIRKDDLHDIAPDGLRAPERDGSARKDGAENQ